MKQTLTKGKAKIISEKGDFGAQKMIRQRKEYYVKIKRQTHQDIYNPKCVYTKKPSCEICETKTDKKEK